MAPGVTFSSSAACEKFKSRAAASKHGNELSGGSLRAMGVTVAVRDY
jgi:hypothetical protein